MSREGDGPAGIPDCIRMLKEEGYFTSWLDSPSTFDVVAVGARNVKFVKVYEFENNLSERAIKRIQNREARHIKEILSQLPNNVTTELWLAVRGYWVHREATTA